MGATNFRTKANGKTALEAFQTAVKAARWEHGHGGYTGTIAEKDGFVEVQLPNGKTTQEFIHDVESFDWEPEKFPTGAYRVYVEKCSKQWGDKWSSAVCVKSGPFEWTFFGLASE